MPSSSESEREEDRTCAEPLVEKTNRESSAPFLGRRSIQDVDSPLSVRELRDLRSPERLEYLRAVKCLSSIPSTVCHGSLHDEFAYIHRKIGDYSHEAAPFLPWHRYFIHIYEQTLKQYCQYEDTLPYWDWTHDWANLTQAPVWSTTEGFGANGNRLNGTAMAAVLGESDYYGFLLKLEDGPHAAIPITVRGDFSRFTAPNDPIFFQVRACAYNGPSRHNSSIAAQLTDPLEMAGLAPDIAVDSVMTIANGLLCYEYQD
ncbi:tyrosinase [Apiospora phragmitis]|uniref:Tyrosinase n=1 Tax=Apiospora phragmitis TaxID=2905665 RepID=A0ABR1V091_9PEZI